MSTYLWINLIIIGFPLTFSFGPLFKYYKNYRALFLSILIVSTTYIAWDILAVIRKDWSFNPLHISGIKFFTLPIEEVLFFITVPYSCLFIYESLLYFFKDKKLSYSKIFYLIIAFLCMGSSFLFKSQYYTFTVLNFCGLFFLSAIFFMPSLLSSMLYWIYIIISFVLFFIFNSILTSLPVVEYNASAIWGIRVHTIPLEDFFYNYSMLSFYFLFYKKWKK